MTYSCNSINPLFDPYSKMSTIVAVAGGSQGLGRTLVDALKADGRYEVLIFGRKVPTHPVSSSTQAIFSRYDRIIINTIKDEFPARTRVWRTCSLRRIRKRRCSRCSPRKQQSRSSNINYQLTHRSNARVQPYQGGGSVQGHEAFHPKCVERAAVQA